MGLFDKVFGKKEETSGRSCDRSCTPKPLKNEIMNQSINARFIVLGACCNKSTQTFENTKVAIKEMGFSDEVVNIGDVAQIASYGVMSTPALVVDGKVVSYGKLLQVEDVKRIIGKIV